MTIMEETFLSMKLPRTHQMPEGMNEAMLVIETGFSPDILDEMPQGLIERMLLYKNVRNAAQYGGVID